MGTGLSQPERDGENVGWIQIGATGSQVATEAEAASMGAEAASMGAEASLGQTQSRDALCLPAALQDHLTKSEGLCKG